MSYTISSTLAAKLSWLEKKSIHVHFSRGWCRI